jgi:cytochrome c-type biogenesis protein CcmF
VIAWRRATAANLRRNLARPALVGVAWSRAASRRRDAARSGAADVRLAASWSRRSGRSCGAACGARRAMSSDSVPRAVVSLVRATAAATAATSCTSGRVGAVRRRGGVPRPSRTRATSSCRSGRPRRVGGYDIKYLKPTSNLEAAGNGRLEKINLGAVMRVSRGGDRVGHAAHGALVLPVRRPDARPRSRASSRARRRARSACAPACGRDVWSAISPSVRDLKKQVAEGDKRVQRTPSRCRPSSARSRSRRRSTASPAPTRQPAARDVPAHRLAAGELDLDRRADRVPAAA